MSLVKREMTVAEQLAAYDRAIQDSVRVRNMLRNGRPPEPATVRRVYMDVALVEEALDTLARQYPNDLAIRERRAKVAEVAGDLKLRQETYTPQQP